jgi:hypothetical protein
MTPEPRGEPESRSHRAWRGLLFAAAALALALPAPAIELGRSSLDGGGGTSSGGALSLTGTIAQWEAGTATAAGLTLRSGFWSAGPASTAAPEGEAPRFSRLALPVPNPFNPRTQIAFTLAADGRISLRVFDVSGRLVRALVEGALPAGEHSAIWDGRDADGGDAASGVYFIQMRAGNFAAVHKAVLVR